MSSFHGHFVWHELKTTDAEAAKRFYQAVIGWAAEDMQAVPGMPYTRLMTGGAPVAGLMALPPEARAAGAKPHWTGHVAVDDLDGMIVALRKAGGSVLFGPMGIPDIGRFANVADPQGAAFSLFEPLPSPNHGPAAPGTPGTVGWNELHAGAWQTAFDFYATLFGWTKDRPVDMGPMGIYQLIALGGPAFGGMMTKMQPDVPPRWLYYFNVSDLSAAVETLKAGGGQVLHGPMEVPGGSWVAQCMDPQGAPFALVKPAP
jgi:predicted enzyme related to lactoylglutathione lyase